MFDHMDWSLATPDEIDRGFDHFGGLRGATDAQLCSLIQAADVAQSWMTDGARSLNDWVAARLRLRHETAAQLVGIANRLSDLPVLSARFACGDLSLDQTDAISRMATAGTEEGLIEEALGLSNAVLDRKARRANPPSAESERAAHRERALWIQRTLDGASGRLTAHLPNLELEIVETAITQRADKMGPDPETGLFDAYSQRMADGLVEVCATSGDQTTVSPPQITVHADLEALVTEDAGVTELGSGTLVPNETARRLSCDCVVETVVTDGRVVVGVGRNTRTIPGWLRRLVTHRDGGHCQFPGCANTRWLQVHHIQHWSHGGATDLDNLILLCGFHHRFVHEHHWHITSNSQNQVVFRRPDWIPYPPPKPGLHPRLAALVATRPT
ncbi:MAG: HNH endonuclease [Acidobacteria bacterium]|nr:MAG: HNH endonuclease [Acidobacteriota bacterium]